MAVTARKLPGLAGAAVVVFGALATAAKTSPARTVAQWADDDRYVAAESGSSRPGKWKNSTSPFAIEPMACLDADYPCRWVVVVSGAQLMKSELGLNWIGQTVCDDAAPMMLVLPSIDELRNWNSTKWQPTVDATPTLRRRVLDIVERSGGGSTTAFKRFKGGFLIVTTAQSSKGLQGRSIKRLILDEVSEFPADAGGRGDPVKQAERRGDAHDDFKALATSTPKDRGTCRITRMYEAGDQRGYYVACPHCGARQLLLFDRMKPGEGGRVFFECLGCSKLIDEVHKPAMIAGGVWIKRYPDRDPDDAAAPQNPDNPAPPECFPARELAKWKARGSAGRDPSFHIWQAYSLLKTWAAVWADYVKARKETDTGKDPAALKVFWQQVLGLAWDAANEAPNHEELFKKRGRFVRRGIVPAWACEIVLAVDVQGDRIEWDAYAMGPDLAMARFDWGVIEIDPLEDAAWLALNEVISRQYEGETTVPLGFDVVGIDSGGKAGVTERVYRFVRNRPNVVALKGIGDPDAIPLTLSKRKGIRLRSGEYITVRLYLVGTWGLKSAVYGALGTALQADKDRLPGGLYNPPDATHEDFKQYVAEVFKQPKSARAGARGWWERIAGQSNERLDLAVYARSLLWWRGAYSRTQAEWQALFAMRARTPEAELPLFALAEAPKPKVEAAPTAANPGEGERRSLFSRRKKL